MPAELPTFVPDADDALREVPAPRRPEEDDLAGNDHPPGKPGEPQDNKSTLHVLAERNPNVGARVKGSHELADSDPQVRLARGDQVRDAGRRQYERTEAARQRLLRLTRGSAHDEGLADAVDGPHKKDDH